MSQDPKSPAGMTTDQASASVCKALVMLAAAALESRTGGKAASVEFVDELNRGATVVEFIVTLRPDHARLLGTEYREADGRTLTRMVLETVLVAAQPGQPGASHLQ